MGFYNGAKYSVTVLAGNDAWQQVIDTNISRRNLVIFVPDGNTDPVKIDMSETLPTDDSTAIDIQQGVMWEPTFTPTNPLNAKVSTGDSIIVWVA